VTSTISTYICDTALIDHLHVPQYKIQMQTLQL